MLKINLLNRQVFQTLSHIKIIKPILRKASKNNQIVRKKNIQLINETFGSLKEIKVSLQENYLIKIFKDQIYKFEKNLSNFYIIDKLPRIILELVSFSLIVIVSLIYFSSSSSIETALPALSISCSLVKQPLSIVSLSNL